SLPLEHLEHPVGDEEAADDVDGAERDGDDEDDLVQRARLLADEHEAAEQHDAVDGVRAGHERRVQRVGHLGDDQEADEAGEHDDRELGDDVYDTLTSPPLDTREPLTPSSSKSSLSSPSSVTSSRNDCTLRA